MSLIDQLRKRWLELGLKYCEDNALLDRRWNSLKDAYSDSKRYYHNLQHLSFMFNEFDQQKEFVNDPIAFQYAIYYHDIIYNVRRKDNEQKSAALAKKQLTEINVPVKSIEKCYDLIVATHLHELSEDVDTNLLIDIDMAILGQPWEVYKTYAKNVRKEYGIYPTIMYKKGRRQALQHFLSMERIFKTDVYFNRYEKQARLNISKELAEMDY
ncbi:MAG: hypothetical protein HUJ25_14650 [Crocinitomicaceae bacterium]|nr:hypothetical protein [Crocinitomicaceae bacterium]